MRGLRRSLFLGIPLLALFLCAAAGGASSPQEARLVPADDYRIGARDLLEITVFELPALNGTVRVSGDGSISLALLGRVVVAGLTPQEMEGRLAALLNEKYTQDAHVTVFVREYQKVAVLGAVASPGMYELIGPTNLLQIIAQAGGLTPLAMTELHIIREGKDGQKSKITVPLKDLIGGDQELNLVLQPKDEILIPVDQLLNVYVYGEVRTPGAISYSQSKKITLMQALAQAGGTTEWASRTRVMIKRKDKVSGKEKQIPVNLRNIIKGKEPDPLLEEGDVIIVP